MLTGGLAFTAQKCLRLKSIEATDEFLGRCKQRLKSIVSCHQDSDSQWQGAKILLVLQVLVGSDKDVELAPLPP